MIQPSFPPEQVTLLDKVTYVAQRSQELLGVCLGRELEIDYLSVYPETEAEYTDMCQQAEQYGGQPVFDKNGNVYKLEKIEGSPIVRVRKPWPTHGQVGCADFVVADYVATSGVLLAQEGAKEIHKEGYDIVEVTHPEYDVAIYFPSERMTDYLMHITRR